MAYVFKGTWEELISDPGRFAGKTVEVDVVIAESAEREGLASDDWLERWNAAIAVIDSFKGKIGPVPPGATSTENLYD